MKISPLTVTYLTLIGAAMLWGGTFIAGRIVAQSIDPYYTVYKRPLKTATAIEALPT